MRTFSPPRATLRWTPRLWRGRQLRIPRQGGEGGGSAPSAHLEPTGPGVAGKDRRRVGATPGKRFARRPLLNAGCPAPCPAFAVGSVNAGKASLGCRPCGREAAFHTCPVASGFPAIIQTIVVGTKTVWPANSKIFPIGHLLKKFADLLV